MTATEIISVRSRGEKGITLNLNTGKSLDVDYAIVSIGAEPNTDFAEKSDLEVDPDFGGYLVNTELQARSHLYIVSYDIKCFEHFQMCPLYNNTYRMKSKAKYAYV